MRLNDSERFEALHVQRSHLRPAVLKALHVLELEFVADELVLPVFDLIAVQVLRGHGSHHFAFEAADDGTLAAVGSALSLLGTELALATCQRQFGPNCVLPLAELIELLLDPEG